ncbi:hypothetical protein SGPA1_21473 [Streptomyces misionensis JCM 4497]
MHVRHRQRARLRRQEPPGQPGPALLGDPRQGAVRPCRGARVSALLPAARHLCARARRQRAGRAQRGHRPPRQPDRPARHPARLHVRRRPHGLQRARDLLGRPLDAQRRTAGPDGVVPPHGLGPVPRLSAPVHAHRLSRPGRGTAVSDRRRGGGDGRGWHRSRSRGPRRGCRWGTGGGARCRCWTADSASACHTCGAPRRWRSRGGPRSWGRSPRRGGRCRRADQAAARPSPRSGRTPAATSSS